MILSSILLPPFGHGFLQFARRFQLVVFPHQLLLFLLALFQKEGFLSSLHCLPFLGLHASNDLLVGLLSDGQQTLPGIFSASIDVFLVNCSSARFRADIPFKNSIEMFRSLGKASVKSCPEA